MLRGGGRRGEGEKERISTFQYLGLLIKWGSEIGGNRGRREDLRRGGGIKGERSGCGGEHMCVRRGNSREGGGGEGGSLGESGGVEGGGLVEGGGVEGGGLGERGGVE